MWSWVRSSWNGIVDAGRKGINAIQSAVEDARQSIHQSTAAPAGPTPPDATKDPTRAGPSMLLLVGLAIAAFVVLK